jgi:hypothetical protein
MPPKQPTTQELVNTIKQLESRLDERDQLIAERLNRLEAAIDNLTSLTRANLERVAETETIPSLRSLQQVTSGDRISRPSNCYGKEGFFQFLRTNLPEVEGHEDMYQRCSHAALVSVQNMQN